jgi:hypothetical protein
VQAHRRPRGTQAAAAGLLAAAWLAPTTAQAAPDAERAPYAHVVLAGTLGKSLRFNNPFRLDAPLGSSGESVSAAAAYVDVAAAVMFGAPWGWQHGAWLHWSAAVTGIGQDVVAPSYVAMWRGEGPAMAYGRFGLPVVLSPNTNVGGELALGAIYMLTGGAGLTAELGASAFYGAATREVQATLVPLLSLQLGVALDWEALP